MAGIRAVLIDLSGTLHVEKVAIPGAQAALRRLRDAGLKVKCVDFIHLIPSKILLLTVEDIYCI